MTSCLEPLALVTQDVDELQVMPPIDQ